MSPEAIALASSIFYAFCIISARRGLKYSTPTTVTFVSLLVHAVTLSAAVFVTGGIPKVAMKAVILFVIGGSLQPIIRLFTYTGVEKIGASRSYTLRATAPLFSAIVAITVLKEQAGAGIMVGTLLIVIGVMFISWEKRQQRSSYRWWHLLFPLTAAVLAGIVHPIRRAGLTISDEPLFFAALVGIVSLFWFVTYLAIPNTDKPVWNTKALLPFIAAGFFETMGILLNISALSSGRVVVVSPIVSTSPLWVVFGSVIFLRDLERVSARTILASCLVVGGTLTISLAR
ncbi:MAG: DMT family transporter [Deltaproteobacteria bacterium]|nr:DMT family transporter [Deltaproteobacteria bacterium]